MSLSKYIISVIGLGYVGLPIALEFGKYFKTIGYDISKKKIQSYRKGIDINNEVAIESFKKAKKLEFTNSEKKISKANIIIVTVPTPIDKVRKPDLSFLESSSKLVAKNIKSGTVVIYESTVYPGVTEEICVPIIEKYSGYEWKKDFFVAYSPERINPGDKNKTLSNIIKVVSGDTPETLKKVSYIYKKIITAGIFEASSIKTAEAAKVIENTQRDINIALMNELSIIFNKMNINTSDVLKAANTKWNFQNYKPGLVGGHCIGVDPYYLVHKASELGIHTEVIQAGRKINDNMSDYLSNLLIKELVRRKLRLDKANVIILGLSFKENVSDIRNSKILDVIKILKSYNINLSIFDPRVDDMEIFKKTKIKNKKSWFDLPSNADAIILAVSHNEFKSISLKNYKDKISDKGVIYDIQSNLDINSAKKIGLKVWQL